jgi:hypothetical protein
MTNIFCDFIERVGGFGFELFQKYVGLPSTIDVQNRKMRDSSNLWGGSMLFGKHLKGGRLF